MFRLQANETSMHCEMYAAQPDTQGARIEMSQLHDDEVSVRWKKALTQRLTAPLQSDQTRLQKASARLHKASARLHRDIAEMHGAGDVQAVDHS
jgi:hypothetical protein